jgi:5-formyltetrahydrofolate cyclo-ligase
LLAGLSDLGVRVLVPVLLPDRDLDWTEWGDASLGLAVLGVAAIGTADALLVPALAVASDGARLGRGGGSYDRALPRRRAGAPVVALLFAGELVASLPRDPWDVAVTAVVTPAGWAELDTAL